MAIAKFLAYLFHGPAWLTFLVMGAAGGGVAVCTFHLYETFSANFELLTTYGVMGLVDGGLRQLLELILWGYAGMACYLVFKGCVDGLLYRVPKRAPPQPPSSPTDPSPR